MSKRYELAKKYNEKYRSSLKPCHHCGSKNIYITTDRTIFNPKNVWSVNCADCGDCVAFKDSVKEAIEIWNREDKGE